MSYHRRSFVLTSFLALERSVQTTTRIAGIGEILMDVFEDGTATVGGAPVNVAFHAHQLLVATKRGHGEVVSAVGRDSWGDHILQTLEESGISTEYVAIYPRYPTGIARVFVGAGEAGFEIAPEAAWDHLVASGALEELAGSCTAVAFGSLAQRSAAARKVIQRFVAGVRGHRLYDVNLRKNTTDGVCGYDAEILKESCGVATILKANSGELEEVAALVDLPDSLLDGVERIWERMEQLRGKFRLKAVVMTRGASGAMLLGEEGRILLQDSTLTGEIHPVGAGDAFSAGLLFGLCSGCDLATSARIANVLASWVTGYVAATPALTAGILEEIQGLMKG